MPPIFMAGTVHPFRWTGAELELLDQRRLPLEVVYRTCRTADEVTEAIRSMVVRGAPAIGVCAAWGIVLDAAPSHAGTAVQAAAIRAAAQRLRAARPTAVNLGWAIDRMLATLERLVAAGSSADAIRDGLAAEAGAIHREDLEGNRRMGELGQSLLPDRCTVLTHCNAGALATSGYGTALGVVRAAHEHGKTISVFADETRPYLQGARLTAWEMIEEGIPVTLITDGMAGHFFAKGTFDAVIVGADRIAANGDAANKIGTYGLAVLAAAHGVPFYVAAPRSTFDPACATGAGIPIEERSPEEVLETHGWDDDGVFHRVRLAPRGAVARHPAFDVTPARLITAIFTETGILRPPFEDAIAAMVAKPARAANPGESERSS